MTLYQYPDYLMHHGVKGMRWGHRRYQNEDGSLTLAGKKRLKYDEAKKLKIQQRLNLLNANSKMLKFIRSLSVKTKVSVKNN